ncbi:hypothetical protein Tco_1557027 [Tanacetum coccineum]
MVYFVDDARAVGVETSLMMDFVRIALLKLKIHSLMIQTRILLIILQIFLTHLHNPSSRHIRASYVGTILTTVMIVHHESRLFRGEKIDDEYEIDYEIRIHKLKQDFNVWGSEVRKKEQAYNEEQYYAARHRMLSIPFVDEDDSISLKDIYARYLLIKSSVENLVPIPSEFEGSPTIAVDMPTCDNKDCVNVESDLLESLINHDTSIVYSSKIDPILEEFAGELAHIALIPPGIVEADFDPDGDTSSDDDDFEDIEYVSLEEVNDVNQEKNEFNLEDILQIQDVILREKLLNIKRLIVNIESLNDNSTPDRNSLPEFESFSDHTEETRSGSTTTHANYSLPKYDSFLFEIEPD